jgi:FKBP-type peptidyl-prolyl cis-trans isomerase FklB
MNLFGLIFVPHNYKFVNNGEIMKAIRFILVLLIGFTTLHAQTKEGQVIFKTGSDSVSYSIGQNIGGNLKDPFMNINFDLLMRGIKDAVKGEKLLTDDQMQNVMMAFNQKLIAHRQEESRVVGEQKKIVGQKFLDENSKQEGVVVLPSGLRYKVLVQGTGISPKPEDKVKVHYTGTLIDGTKFDSSYDRNEPAVFGVTQVIKGWTEALQLMKVGDKWQLFIPSELAYGENGAGNVIGPNEVLIFEVELLDVIQQ